MLNSGAWLRASSTYLACIWNNIHYCRSIASYLEYYSKCTVHISVSIHMHICSVSYHRLIFLVNQWTYVYLSIFFLIKSYFSNLQRRQMQNWIGILGYECIYACAWYAIKVKHVLQYFSGQKKYSENTRWKFRYATTLNYPSTPYYFWVVYIKLYCLT